MMRRDGRRGLSRNRRNVSRSRRPVSRVSSTRDLKMSLDLVNEMWEIDRDLEVALVAARKLRQAEGRYIPQLKKVLELADDHQMSLRAFKRELEAYVNRYPNG